VKLIVFRAGCSYRQRFERMMDDRGIPRAGVMEFGTLDGILGCVAAGMGVTLLPRVVVEGSRQPGLRMHRLPPAEAQVDTVFVRRRDTFASPALERFLEVARQAWRRTRPAAPEDRIVVVRGRRRTGMPTDAPTGNVF
jgi:DNA-binding transcriptional LysR family regulator